MNDMAHEGEHRALRYSAFISYSHHDTTFARKLQRKLETYSLPRRVIAAAHAPFDVRRRLRPVFRDREELAAAPDVAEAVEEAISQASYLIVVCSASAAGSAWVGRELALFRNLRGSHAILVAIAEDSTPDTIDAVLHGDASCNASLQPLAADFSAEGDGARLALLKLIAVLAGVRLDELVQRDAQRRVRAITRVSLGALAGMAAMTVMAAIAVKARHVAEHERARGEALIDYMLTDLRKGLKGAGRLDLLDKVNRGVAGYFGAQDLNRLSDAELRQRVQLLHDMGADDVTRGKLDQARGWFEQAKRTTEARLAARPNDLDCIFDDSQSEYFVGFVDWRTGDTASAEVHFKKYASLVDRLVRAEPDNPRWLIERGYADSNLGMFLMRHALDLAQAEPLFVESLAALCGAAARQAYDPDMQVQIADGYGWLGDVERLRRNYDKARDYRSRQKAMLDTLLAQDNRNAEARASVVYNDLALARIDAERDAYVNAFQELSEGQAMALALETEDPENMDMHEQVQAFDLFRARTIMMQSSLVGTHAPHMRLNCDFSEATANQRELSAFCVILRARMLVLAGDLDGAKTILARRQTLTAAAGDLLTAHWGVNLRQEADGVFSNSK